MIERIKKFFGKNSSQPSYKVSNESKDAKFSRRFMNDLGAKIMCVFAAICLWFYVIGAESPTFENTFTVPISLENASNIGNNLSVLSGYGAYAEVVLSGKRSEINKIKAQDLYAYVDLSDITKAGTYTLDVYVSPVSNASVIVKNPASLVVYVDKTITKAVADIDIEYTGIVKSEKLSIDELRPAVPEILVEGPTQYINKIEKARVTLELDNIEKSVKVRQKIELVDANGEIVSSPYIKTEPSELDVEVVVTMEKEFPIVAKYKHGYFDEEYIECNILPPTIILKGDPDLLNNIEYIATEPIDETQIEGILHLKSALSIPGQAYAAQDKRDVTVTIPGYTEKEIIIPNGDIAIKGSKDGVSADIKTQLSVMVCGPAEVVQNIHASDIDVEVQLNGDERVGDSNQYLAVISTRKKNIFLKNHTSRTVEIEIVGAGTAQ